MLETERIVIANWEHEAPADRAEDHLGSELPAFQAQIRLNFGGRRCAIALAWRRSRQAATMQLNQTAHAYIMLGLAPDKAGRGFPCCCRFRRGCVAHSAGPS